MYHSFASQDKRIQLNEVAKHDLRQNPSGNHHTYLDSLRTQGTRCTQHTQRTKQSLPTLTPRSAVTNKVHLEHTECARDQQSDLSVRRTHTIGRIPEWAVARSIMTSDLGQSHPGPLLDVTRLLTPRLPITPVPLHQQQ